VHVTFNTSVPAKGKAEYKLTLGGKAVPNAKPLAAQDGNKVTLDTGVLKAVVNGDKFNLLDGAWVDESGKQQYDDAHQVLAPGHDGGFKMTSSFFGLPKNKLYTAGAAPAKVEVLENDSLRAVIKVSGRMTSADDLEGPKDPFSYECYLYAYRNWPALRVTYVFHMDTGEGIKAYTPVDGIYLDLPTKLGGALRAAFGNKEKSAEAALGAATDRAWLEVDNSEKARGGGKLTLAEFAPKADKPKELGWASLASDKLAVNVGVKWFWQLSPKSLEFAGDGRVRIGLWPNVNDEVRKVAKPEKPEKALFSELEPRRGNWYMGMSKTHEILLGFGSKGQDLAAAEKQWAWLSCRLLAEAPTSWYCQGSRVWGRLADSAPELFGEEELAAVKDYDRKMRAGLDFIVGRNDKVQGKWDCYNIFNFGDHVNFVEDDKLPNWAEVKDKKPTDRSQAYQSIIHWDNGYYGFTHGLIIQWARTGDPLFLQTAEYFDTHVSDIDTVWAVNRKACGASRYCAGPMHITMYGDQGGDHNYIYQSGTFNHFKLQEHFEHYYLFGDWQARDAGLQGENFVLALGNDGVDWGQSRSMGHGLLAMLAGYYATGEAKYLNAAKSFLDRIIKQYKGGRRIDKGQWWMGGIAMEAIREFWEQTGYAPAREQLEAFTKDCLAKSPAPSCIHAAGWLAGQTEDAEIRKKALKAFKGTAGVPTSWGAVMGYGNNQRNTGYAVWWFTKDLPKKDAPIELGLK
jgi:hypothetical protein